jgi:hypothetical protein
MPFYIYERDENESQYVYSRKYYFDALPRKIIQPKLDQINKSTDADKCRWKLSSYDISKLLFQTNSDLQIDKKYVIVVDLKPKSNTDVSLFQIENIYGYSYEDWTPLCLELRIVYDDNVDVQNLEEQKESLVVKKLDFQKRVYEFLYILKGWKSGKLNWGMTGSVNAPLLWPDAMGYFIRDCIKITE